MLKGYGQVRASKWPIVAVESATVKDETGHIGHQIRQVREQRGVSREKLAVKTGVSVTVIRRIETRNEGGRKSVDILRAGRRLLQLALAASARTGRCSLTPIRPPPTCRRTRSRT